MPWAPIPGGLKQIDTGLSGAVWGVNKADQIWKLNKNGKTWTRISEGLKHVTAGVGGVWGVSSNDKIWYREGKFKTKFRGYSLLGDNHIYKR